MKLVAALAVAADQGNAARFAAVSDDVVREENRFEAAAARAANPQQASE